MTINNRSEEEQQRLNNHMGRQDVLEWILFQSFHAAPASEEQVKRFLAAAPPEIFVLLDGLMPPSSPADIRNEILHENRILQGFVGTAMERGKRAWMGP